jgi:transposase
VNRPFHSATPTTPFASSDAEIIEQLKQQLDVTSERLRLSELRVQLLEDKLRLQRIAKYGPGSEKLTSQQLELLELEPGVSNLEVAAESEREALPATPDKKKRKHPGRQTLPANLPRVERVIDCTSEQCVCGGCGQSTTVIGYEESEQLDVEPVKYFVLVTRREKRACKSCEERGVMAAPLPPRILEKSLVSDQVILDAIIGKYSNHCPLYRQSVILLRDAGVDISRATIDGWVMQVGDLLMPLVAVMGRQLVGGTYIQADDRGADGETVCHRCSGTR